MHHSQRRRTMFGHYRIQIEFFGKLMKIIELMAKPFVGDCIAIGHLQFLETCLGEDNEIAHSKGSRIYL